MAIIETSRLLLRQWRDCDKPVFANMNNDPDVMRYFPAHLSRDDSDRLVQRFQDDIESTGWGFWAAERKDTNQFIGFIGINYSSGGLPFAPCVDIGWRLSKQNWGQGFATEGAQASLDYGFKIAGLDEIVSMTPVANLASQRVMQKLKMVRDENTFMHPKLDAESPLAEHVLFRITQAVMDS